VFRAGNAVIVDARNRAEYATGTIPAAQSILGGEAGQAKEDRRLRYLDANTRILVFANNARAARAVAEELTRNAYPNTSYFNGSYEELKRARFFSERKPPPSNFDGFTR
jgi:rhodanese-related sulfurtransferase